MANSHKRKLRESRNKPLCGKLSSLETQFEECVLRMKSLWPEIVNIESKSSCLLHAETIYFHNFVCSGTLFFKILHYVAVCVFMTEKKNWFGLTRCLAQFNNLSSEIKLLFLSVVLLKTANQLSF